MQKTKMPVPTGNLTPVVQHLAGCFTPRKMISMPIGQKAGCAPEPVWTCW